MCAGEADAPPPYGRDAPPQTGPIRVPVRNEARNARRHPGTEDLAMPGNTPPSAPPCPPGAIPPAPASSGCVFRLDGPGLLSTDKKGRVVGQLSPKEHDALLAAFAHSGPSADARARGAAVVRAYQQQHRWFRCPCLGVAERAPILVPVAESFIRREASYPDHADGCPFEMIGPDREPYFQSLRERDLSDGFQLTRAIKRPDAIPPRDAGPDEGDTSTRQRIARGSTKAYERSRVSQLLFKLVSDARLHRIGTGPRGIEAQRHAMQEAAQRISLGSDLRLSAVLELDPDRIDDLVGRIRLRARWPKGRRPHGVLVFIAERIEGDAIIAASGTRLTVEGPISVFGPGKGRVRHGPFAVAVLVASPDGSAPLMPLEAYAHPCWSATDLLPVDSTHERRCADILVSFQSWMAGKGLTVEITKPLYDRSGYYLGREEADIVVKPDFEAKVLAADSRFIRSIVVEVMGFTDRDYTARKARLKDMLAQRPGYYLEHLAHDGVTQAEGDWRFRKDLLSFGERIIAKERDAADRPQLVRLPPRPAPPPVPVSPPVAPPKVSAGPYAAAPILPHWVAPRAGCRSAWKIDPLRG